MRAGVGVLAFLLLGTAVPSRAQIDARMLRYPAVSATQIAFVYAGDIWLVAKGGGVAVRLSSPAGEESFPRFSPDGSMLAYSADYDGNLDVYVMPATGGVPVRVTHHPAPDRMLGWYPDGRSILFATSMTAGKDRFNQLYRVAATGGLPEKLPVPYGEFGVARRDGKTSGLHAADQRLPHLEALPRRLGARHLAVRPRDARREEPHARPRPTTPSRCGTATRSTSSPTATRTSAATSGRSTGERRDPPGHPLRRVRRALPVDRALRHRVRERGPPLPAGPAGRGAPRGQGRGRDRPGDAEAAGGERRQADRQRRHLARPASARCSRRAATSSRCRPSTASCST